MSLVFRGLLLGTSATRPNAGLVWKRFLKLWSATSSSTSPARRGTSATSVRDTSPDCVKRV
jgi:hypothetical protein